MHVKLDLSSTPFRRGGERPRSLAPDRHRTSSREPSWRGRQLGWRASPYHQSKWRSRRAGVRRAQPSSVSTSWPLYVMIRRVARRGPNVLSDGKNLLQLTNFGRGDTGVALSSFIGRGRVFFIA